MPMNRQVRKDSRYIFLSLGPAAFPGSGARKERTTEIARLKRELARVTEERDMLKNPPGTLPKSRREVPVYADASAGVSKRNGVRHEY